MKLDHTLRQDRDGVPEPIRPGLSNRRLEGLNNKIGVIKHRAYGFDSFAAFAAMVFLCSVALQLKLPICVKKAKTASIETRSGHQDR